MAPPVGLRAWLRWILIPGLLGAATGTLVILVPWTRYVLVLTFVGSGLASEWQAFEQRLLNALPTGKENALAWIDARVKHALGDLSDVGLPPNGTDGLARQSVSGPRREPRPPASTMARVCLARSLMIIALMISVSLVACIEWTPGRARGSA